MREGLCSITLPLVRSSAPVKEALEEAKLRGVGAIATSDGVDFRVYSISALHNAAAAPYLRHPSSLSMPEAVVLDLRTPASYADQVQQLLTRYRP
jgi:hypothetical protein